MINFLPAQSTFSIFSIFTAGAEEPLYNFRTAVPLNRPQSTQPSGKDITKKGPQVASREEGLNGQNQTRRLLMVPCTRARFLGRPSYCATLYHLCHLDCPKSYISG